MQLVVVGRWKKFYFKYIIGNAFNKIFKKNLLWNINNANEIFHLSQNPHLCKGMLII